MAENGEKYFHDSSLVLVIIESKKERTSIFVAENRLPSFYTQNAHFFNHEVGERVTCAQANRL